MSKDGVDRSDARQQIEALLGRCGVSAAPPHPIARASAPRHCTALLLQPLRQGCPHQARHQHRGRAPARAQRGAAADGAGGPLRAHSESSTPALLAARHRCLTVVILVYIGLCTSQFE
jgi:hypothetical protein